MKNDGEFFKVLLDSLYDGVYCLDREGVITFWNRGAERLTGYSKAEVIGRKCSDDLLVHLNDDGERLCGQQCLMAKSVDDGLEREAEVYFRHKHGHRVPVQVRISPVTDRQGTIVGAVQVFSDNFSKRELEKRLAELNKQALLDPLTQVANRRAMEVYLNSRREEFQRFQWPFGILFVDIDRFKQVNDRHGHLMGDEVLKMVARTLSGSKRPFDIVGRWGGEEFVVIIANVDRKKLRSIAERYRNFVERSKLTAETAVIRVTVSIGATLCREDDSVYSLINRADQLMYRCKKEGRNCVRADGTP